MIILDFVTEYWVINDLRFRALPLSGGTTQGLQSSPTEKLHLCPFRECSHLNFQDATRVYAHIRAVNPHKDLRLTGNAREKIVKNLIAANEAARVNERREKLEREKAKWENFLMDKKKNQDPRYLV